MFFAQPVHIAVVEHELAAGRHDLDRDGRHAGTGEGRRRWLAGRRVTAPKQW